MLSALRCGGGAFTLSAVLAGVFLCLALNLAGAESATPGGIGRNGAHHDELRERALAGEVTAQLELAQEFFAGKNRRKNFALAFYYFKKAAAQNSPEGLFNLGVCYEQGIGVEANLPLAYSCYLKAAQLGLAAADFQVGRHLLVGVPGVRTEESNYPPVGKDIPLALKHLRRAAEKGFKPAERELALAALNPEYGKKTQEEIAQAMEYLRLNLPENDGHGWCKLADAYYLGRGGEKSPERMFEALSRAAAAGNAEGMAKLAYALYYGDGTAADSRKAFEYFSKAAGLGHPGAVAKMGEYYLSGEFVKPSVEKAYECFARAAEYGSPVGLYQKGRCRVLGWGTVRDTTGGMDDMLAAANAGELRAQLFLAGEYEKGAIVPQDNGGALYWYKQAASLGSSEAMKRLAVMMYRGIGCKADAEAARKLLETAAAMGDGEAQEMLKRFLFSQ